MPKTLRFKQQVSFPLYSTTHDQCKGLQIMQLFRNEQLNTTYYTLL